MADADYWAALAQVIPVLALALVVVAREVTKQWNVVTPWRLRFTQATLWAVTLSMLTFGELTALNALRGGEVSSLWTRLTEVAVGVALGLLILVPVIEFAAKGNAEGVARMLTGFWIPRLRLALSYRRLFRWHRKLNEERHQRWLILQNVQALIGQLASSVAQLRAIAALDAEFNDPHLKAVSEEQLGKATLQLEDATQDHAGWLRDYRRLIVHELERHRVLHEERMTWRRDTSEARIKVRQAAVRAMLAFRTEDAFRGVDQQQKSGLSEDVNPEDVDPDDGGFFALPQIGRSAQDGDGAAAVGGGQRSSSRGKRQYT